MGTGLITVPLTLSYLGQDRYGLWMTLASFVTFLIFTDMGFGIGLQNALARCYGRNDRDNPRFYVSSGLFTMTVFCLVFVFGAIFVLPCFDLGRVVTVQSEAAARDLSPTAQAMLMAFGFGLPAGMIQRILNAYQYGYWGNIQLAVGNILSLVGVLACVHFGFGLPALAFIFMGTPFFVLLCGSVVLFWKYEWLRPTLPSIRWDSVKHILGIGLKAAGAQAAALIMISGPPLVIANRIGTSAVTSFAITQQLVGVMMIVLTMGIMPLWPAYSEASARGDWAWVRRTFARTVRLGMIVLVPTFIVISLAGRWIIRVWTQHPEVVPSWPLLMAFSVWMLIRGWNTVCCTLLNGLNHMLGQAIYGTLFGILGLTFGYYIAPHHGVAGATWTIVLVGEVLRCIGITTEVAWLLRHNRPQSSQIGEEE